MTRWTAEKCFCRIKTVVQMETIIYYRLCITNLRWIKWSYVGWIDLTQDKGQWRALVNTVMNQDLE
jgi:hypothetical protein